MSIGEKVIAELLNSVVNYEDSCVVGSKLTMARVGLLAWLHYLNFFLYSQGKTPPPTSSAVSHPLG